MHVREEVDVDVDLAVPQHGGGPAGPVGHEQNPLACEGRNASRDGGDAGSILLTPYQT